MGVLSFLIEKEWLLSPRKRPSWIVTPARSFKKDLHFQWTEKEFIITSFSKVNALIKGAESQEKLVSSLVKLINFLFNPRRRKEKQGKWKLILIRLMKCIHRVRNRFFFA